MRRWLGLALLPTSFVILHVLGVLVGAVFPGRLDSIIYGVLSLLELGAAAWVGVLLGRQLTVPAAWSLPFGIATAMAIWLLLPRQGASTGYAALGLVVWALLLTALGLVTVSLLERSRRAGLATAILGGIALWFVIPFLVVRMTLGAEAAPWWSVAGWSPVGLVDYSFAFDVSRLDALTHASMPAVLVMLGTAFALGYLIGAHDGARVVQKVAERAAHGT